MRHTALPTLPPRLIARLPFALRFFFVANQNLVAQWDTFSLHSQRAHIAKNRGVPLVPLTNTQAPGPLPEPRASSAQRPAGTLLLRAARKGSLAGVPGLPREPSNFRPRSHALFAGWVACLNWLAGLMDASFNATRLALLTAGEGPVGRLAGVLGQGEGSGAKVPFTPSLALCGRPAPLVRAVPPPRWSLANRVLKPRALPPATSSIHD